MRIRFAFQVLYGTLNNILLNAPGALRLEDEALPGELPRVFHLAMAFDDESADGLALDGQEAPGT